ncbi:MAG: exo-alpha-sialidase [Clostridia bacterium]|nr:exo-alpha-sialidase [Clostridia bacterium]
MTDHFESHIIRTPQADLQILRQATVFAPTAEDPTPALTYPRIVRLQHSGVHNGILLSTAESLHVEAYLIHRSDDDGRTWRQVGEVTSHIPEWIANWQPMLYELPCTVGDMPAGTLLLAGCVRNRPTSETAMCIYRSNDLGASWTLLSTVAEGGGFSQTGGLSKGLWEPFLLCDEQGMLWCFYSDELDAERHSQMLVCRSSTDGIHWSETRRIVACADPHLRPGMITVTRMGDGRYFLAYEMVGIRNNPVYGKTTADLSDWGDPADPGARVETPEGKGVGSTPYCCWLPAGGDGGTLIVTGKNHSGTGESKTGTDWLVSHDFGKTWTAVDNPLPYTPNGLFRYAYSPGLFAAEDGKTLYYVNDINSEEVPSKAKIQLALIEVSARGD